MVKPYRLDVLNRILTAEPAVYFIGAALVILTYVFYSTDFHDNLEDYFFDLRTRWKPQPSSIADVVVVGINDRTVAALDGPTHKDITVESLAKILSVITQSEAVAGAVLLHSNIVDHNDPKLEIIKDIVKFDHRILIGTMEYHRADASLQDFPPMLKSIHERIKGIETLKKRSNSILRDLPYAAYRRFNKEYLLPVYIANELRGTFGDIDATYRINFLPSDRFKTIDGADLVAEPGKYLKELAGQVVIVGYTVFRPMDFQTSEQMTVNTPLKANERNYSSGEHITYVVANAVENLLHDRILTDAPPFVNFLQTLGFALICIFLWRFSSMTASLATGFLWLALVYVHGLLYHYLAYDISLADTFFAASLVTVVSAVRKLSDELRTSAEKAAVSRTQRELASVHTHFLDQFSFYLYDLTTSLLTVIKALHRRQTDLQLAGKGSPATVDLLTRALTSGQDFIDYLEGIKQLAVLSGRRLQSYEKHPVAFCELAGRIAQRFQSKLDGKKMRLNITCEEDIKVFTNEKLLDAILFNLISNAVKYAPADTSIEVTCTRPTPDLVTISVRDHGPGIAPELQEKIFEKFYRIKDDRIYTAKGTGLGLYFCKFFATQLGGRIDCISEPGMGAEFRLTLNIRK